MEKVHRYTDFSVRVDPEELPRYLGYRRDRRPNAELAELLKEMTAEAEALARPAAILSLFDSENVPGQEQLPRKSFLYSLLSAPPAKYEGEREARKAAKAAGESSDSTARVALSICTIGPELEAKVSEYSASGALARALILDAAGSSLAEAVCDFANGKICEMAVAEPLYAAPRISPGYGRWSVEEQDIMFTLLPADSIGVFLTKSYMMVPRKSVSFAVKLTEEKPNDDALSPCVRCRRKECEFRR
jgi:hypothetical protein